MQYQVLTVGNPNSGKTTLFNALTGEKQQVGNWAGVTVDKKTGEYQYGDDNFELTDLPGIYSLDSSSASNSLDESIASKAVTFLPADVIINVVDATSLERSLFMTLQLRELGRPMVVVLNKMDALKRERRIINTADLEKALGCPVVDISATNKKRVTDFKAKLQSLLKKGIQLEPLKLDYQSAMEDAIQVITPIFVDSATTNVQAVAPRSLALGALENASLVIKTLDDAQNNIVQQQIRTLDTDIDLHISDIKYTFLHELCKKVRRSEGKLSRNFTEQIDKFVLNRWIGVPFFFVVMYLMFMFSINIGSAFIDFFDIGVGTLLVDGGHYLMDGHLPVWLVTVLADGVGGGIKTVTTFIPQIACLFLFLTVVESSGYMARAAFVLDKVMQKIGLPGKAFVPLVLGFGCNVPSVMATRTLDQERERKLAATMAPFMSCSARLPVYALFSSAFFPAAGQNVVFALYLLGIVASIFTGLFMKKTIYPGSSDNLVMEMPNYEFPTIRNVGLKTWQKLKRFVLGAGKTIVLVVTVLSFLNSVGTDGSFGHEDSNNSMLSKIAQVVTPALAPMGIEQDNWPATVGIITGVFAKEAVIGTLNSLYTSSDDDNSEYDLVGGLTDAVMSIPENLTGLNYSDPLGMEVGDLSDTATVAEDQGVGASIFANLRAKFGTGNAAFAYLVFILLYVPCVAAIGAYVREFGRKFAVFISIWTTGLAYIAASVCYQVSQFSTSPVAAISWVVGAVVVYCVTYIGFKRTAKKQQQFDEVII